MTNTNNTHSAKKIRAGYYGYRGWEIEKLDEAAERYPGDLGYGDWLTYDENGRPSEYYQTMRDAKEAIDAEAK